MLCCKDSPASHKTREQEESEKSVIPKTQQKCKMINMHMIGKKGSVGRGRFITSQYQEGKMMIMTEEISGSEVISQKE